LPNWVNEATHMVLVGAAGFAQNSTENGAAAAIVGW
jgi:hypothetical protein